MPAGGLIKQVHIEERVTFVFLEVNESNYDFVAKHINALEYKATRKSDIEGNISFEVEYTFEDTSELLPRIDRLVVKNGGYLVRYNHDKAKWLLSEVNPEEVKREGYELKRLARDLLDPTDSYPTAPYLLN